MSAPVFQIEKLDENNYDTWCIQMRSILIHNGFWKIVSGAIKRPTAGEDASVWESNDEKALASIILSVKPTQLGYIKNSTTSHDAWKKLEEIYMPRGPIQKVCLYKRLVNLKLHENGNLIQHLNEFTEIYEKLGEVNIQIQEELLVIMLLSSLSRDFDHFVIAIETRDELPTITVLKQKLLEESKRRHEKDEEEKPTQQAFTASTTKAGNKSKKNNNKNFKGKCFVCGITGHYASKCRKGKQNANTQAMTMQAAADASAYNNNKWYVDSGATSHMCNNRQMFHKFVEHKELITLAGNKHINAVGKGDVYIRHNNYNILLQNVLYSPVLQANFISVSKAVDRGLTVHFNAKMATIKRADGDVILRAVRKSNMFEFNNNAKQGLFYTHNNESNIWHNRYGHLNMKSLFDLSNKNMVNGLKLDRADATNCKTCMLSKIHVLPFPKESQTKSKKLLELVHCDVCGPFREKSVGGSKYFVSFIDDMSRRIFVYFMANKGEVFEKFKSFKSMVERQTGCKIKNVRTDNGKEFVNNDFNAYLEKEGICRQLTVPYTPQQNGVAERANRTLVEMARSMMVHSNVKKYLWAEAINTAVYIRNRCPTRTLNNMTPYEMWSGRKPSVQHFRVFGCMAVVLDKAGSKSKFDAKGSEMIMVGYSNVAKAYRLYDVKKNKIFEHRDVLFKENAFNNDDVTEQEKELYANDLLNITFGCQTEQAVEDTENKIDAVNENEHHSENTNTDDEDIGEADDITQEPIRGPGRPRIIRSGKPGRPRKQYNELCTAVDEDIPQSFEQAISVENSNKWFNAMTVEIEALRRNKTWSLVDLPRGHTAIPCKWVYAIKRDANGKIERYKARLVAKGCMQRFGINFHETFSPVIRYSTIRIVLALAVKKKMHLHQLDVSTAYLNSNLHDEVYMKQPHGFEDKDNPNKVLRLHKAIYGLKQSGKEWNAKLDATLRQLNLSPCDNEPCLYKGNRNGKLILVAVYVDDLIVGCADKSIVIDIKKSISQAFDISDKGQLRHFLGMEIEREGEVGPIKLSQRQYIRDTLSQYGMENCKPVAVPLEAGYQVNCNNDCEKADQHAYQSLVGTLMYLGVSTRPDILHSICKMAQRNNDPHKEHMTKLKHILRYLAGTVELKLHFNESSNNLEGFVDADWGGDYVDRKSYTGFNFYFSGCLITWESRKQSSVALSSTEAEYMAVSDASKEAIYLKRLLQEICAVDDGPVVIRVDNQGAQKLAENPIHHKRSKHIDIRFHHIRQLVQNKEVKLEYCPTTDMVADVMTKNLSKIKHYNFLQLMNLE